MELRISVETKKIKKSSTPALQTTIKWKRLKILRQPISTEMAK